MVKNRTHDILGPAKRLIRKVSYEILKENVSMKRVLGLLLALAVMVGMSVTPGFSQEKKDEKKAAAAKKADKKDDKKAADKKADKKNGKAAAKKGDKKDATKK